MGSMGAAVSAITSDNAPIISVFESKAARMNGLAMENRLTKQESLQLLTAARRAQVASTLAGLTNPVSIRAVTDSCKLQHMVGDVLSTLRSNGQICVPVSLDRAAAIVEAQVVLLERDSLGLIKSGDVSTAERNFVSFSLDRSKTSTFNRGAGGRGGASTRGKGKNKGKGRQKGKSTLNQVSGGSVGKSNKPRSGGCHRCGGPHFVRSCTVAVQKPAN